MHLAVFIASVLSGLLLVSCSSSSSVTPRTEERSVEQRVADLEQHLNRNAPKLNEAEAREQYEHELGGNSEHGAC